MYVVYLPQPDNMTKEDFLYLEKSLAPFYLETESIAKFSLYIDIINEYKNKIRLIGVRNNIQIIDYLLIPSIISRRFIDKTVLMDIGSGSGIFGITVKIIIKDVELNVVERNMKKIAFISDIVNKLDIKDVHIIPKSLENIENNCLQCVEQLLIRGIKLVDIYQILLDKFPRGTSIVHFSTEEEVSRVPVQIIDKIAIPASKWSLRKPIYIFSLQL